MNPNEPADAELATPPSPHGVTETGGRLRSLQATNAGTVPLSTLLPETVRPLRFGSLALSTRYLLSPLAGYTTLPFRLAVRELGPLGLATTDLVNARALLRESRKTLELIQTSVEDRPLAVQIYGSEQGEMCAAAQWLEAFGVSALDINMGCPVHKVVKKGGGSAMMCDPAKTTGLVRAVVEAVRLPVTVKMRLGWDNASWSAPAFAREFEQAGVSAVIIHGRTREQGFSGRVNLEGIRAVVAAVERIPVVGNGDVRTIADAERMFAVTGCTAISIGRGALLNPWIFSQLQTWETTRALPPPPGFEQRLQFMERHFRLLVAQRGEHFACLTFRKVANWYCKVLRVGRVLQQRLIRLESVQVFDDVISRLRDLGLRPGIPDVTSPSEISIPVPAGPMDRW